MARAQTYLAMMMALLVSACVSQWDFQGVDPKVHYKQHPIENKVETKNETYTVRFNPYTDMLTADEIGALRAGLGHVSPTAVESVQVQLHPSQAGNEGRKEHLTKLLASMGYPKRSVFFESSEAVERDDARLDVAFASVVSPRCPDWRSSPVTTYSNTGFGGFGCASVTNLGLQVADPRDLERGTSDPSPNPDRNAKVLEQYRNNETPGSEGSGTDSTSNATAPTTP